VARKDVSYVNKWLKLAGYFGILALIVSAMWYFSIWQSKKIPSGMEADKIIHELRQEAAERLDKTKE
jgi:hypothetical protein